MLVLSGLDNSAVGGMAWRRSRLVHERADDLHAIHGPGAGWAIVRSVSGRKARRQLAIPLAANRRFAGIVRRIHSEEHELGGSEPSAASRGDPAPAVRSPVWRKGTGLGQSQAEHPRRGPAGCDPAAEGLAEGRRVAVGRAPFFDPRSGARRRSLPPDYRKVRRPTRTST